MQPLVLEQILPKLICPETGGKLHADGSWLISEDLGCRYPVEDGIPDLRRSPSRLSVDVDWYEPWEDLDSIPIALPKPSEDADLPYHLDRHMAGVIPVATSGEWTLEVGCGERQHEFWFRRRGYNYIGTDIDSRGRGPNVLADGHNLPVADNSMDLCISVAVLEHVISPLIFTREIFRVLRPGGRFVGSAAFMYGFHDRASFHHMSHAGLLHVLRSMGFHMERMWADWKYPDSISAWPFRGAVGYPWRLVTRSMLRSAEWSFTTLSNITRKLVGKPLLDRNLRDIQMAGSVSFVATKPPIEQ